MQLIIRYRGSMKKISLIVFIYFIFITNVIAQTFSMSNNYSWESEAFRYSYQLKDEEGNWITVVDDQKYYIIKEGRHFDSSRLPAVSGRRVILPSLLHGFGQTHRPHPGLGQAAQRLGESRHSGHP